MSLIEIIRGLLGHKSPTKLLDDHIDEASVEAIAAFPTDGIPYRTADRFLDQKPVTEEDLARTEAALEAWLFRRFERQDSTYVVVSNTLEIPPGESGYVTFTAQRTFQVCRLVLFSSALDQCKVMSFNIGVESQGEFIAGGVNATLYRLLNFSPVQFSHVFQVGHSAMIQVKNTSTEPVSISGVLLGHLPPENSHNILERVRGRKLTIRLIEDGDEP